MDFDQIFGDDGIADYIFDAFDSFMPSIFALSVNLYNKYKYHLKLLIVLIFTARIMYRLFYLNITKSSTDLRYKFAFNLINIITLIYCIYSEVKSDDTENFKKIKKID